MDETVRSKNGEPISLDTSRASDDQIESFVTEEVEDTAQAVGSPIP